MISRNELDRLLARGRLSGPRRDRIFESVERRVHPIGAVVRSRFVMIAGPLVLAAAVALVLKPAAFRRDEFASKGGPATTVQIDCLGGTLSACPRGSKLAFRLDAGASRFYVQAYAQPDDPGAERVWYFPTASAPAPYVDTSAEDRKLEKGIVIGPEHGAHRYRIHVVTSSMPLSREEVLRGAGPAIRSNDVANLEIVEP
jgi:hypothetical protein